MNLMEGRVMSTEAIRVLIVVGTRPEAIKMAPVILELDRRTETIPFVVATSQHREMLHQVLKLFDIQPDRDLDLMVPDQTLYDVTGRAIQRFESVIQESHADFVLVQGDTTTSFMGALAGFYEKIPVGHIEAVLRTHNMYSPFPEEMNRRMVTVLSDYHFAPTQRNKDNLLREGIDEERILITGNTVIDALFRTVEMDVRFDIFSEEECDRMLLITAHRRENFGTPLIDICMAVRALAESHPEILFIYPVHLNPNVQKPVKEHLDGIKNVRLLEPLDYLSFSHLMAKSYLILTDSGGIQEEGPSLGKPVLVLRNETERPEAVEAGTVIVVGTNTEDIIRETERLLSEDSAYKKMSRAHNPYGDGKASQRIVDFLIRRSQ